MKSQQMTKTKQKVVVGVAVAAILVSSMAIATAVGRSRGYGFGYPIIKRTLVATMVTQPLEYKKVEPADILQSSNPTESSSSRTRR